MGWVSVKAGLWTGLDWTDQLAICFVFPVNQCAIQKLPNDGSYSYFITVCSHFLPSSLQVLHELRGSLNSVHKDHLLLVFGVSM